MLRLLRIRTQRAFILLVFRLLYYEANWAYPLSAWLVSVGAWRQWQQLLLKEVKGKKVLEVGFGRGWLLKDLQEKGYYPTGIDLSPTMAKKARKYVPEVPLVRGDGRCLPFEDASFDTVIMCFAGLCFTPSALNEASRVLVPGGCLAITEIVYLKPKQPLEWLARLLWGITETDELPSAESLLEQAGLKSSSYWVGLGFAEVQVTVGEKIGTQSDVTMASEARE